MILGYVVSDERGPCLLSRYGDGEPEVLVHGNQCTLFMTRRKARQAIERSRAYSTRNNLFWPDDYVILRVT